MAEIMGTKPTPEREVNREANRQHPDRPEAARQERHQVTLDDIDDPDLKAEFEMWERASNEDFLKFISEHE